MQKSRLINVKKNLFILFSEKKDFIVHENNTMAIIIFFKPINFFISIKLKFI